MNSKLAWLDKFKDKNTTDFVKLILFFFVVFSFSLNLFYKISLDGAYLHGLLVDYLIPKIYLAEIFLIPFLFMEAKQLKKIKINNFLCLATLLLLVRQLSSHNALAAFTHLAHFVEILLFFQVVRHDPLFKTKLAAKFIQSSIFAVIIFQSLLAFYQFFFQQSLLAYHFLGETNLQDLANITRAQFFFGERILPYGTLAHPNILAGLIVILSILIWPKLQASRNAQLILLGNALLIIFLTQSVTALLTLGLFAAYKLIDQLKVKKTIIVLTYYFFLLLLPLLLSRGVVAQMDSNSINRRVALNQAALEMFRQNSFFGVGINNFTVALENISGNSLNQEVVRFVQPVHHLLFLILSEGGLLVVVVLLLLISQVKIDKFYQKTMILLAIASLDHYLLTQFSGISLLALFYLFVA